MFGNKSWLFVFKNFDGKNNIKKIKVFRICLNKF